MSVLNRITIAMTAATFLNVLVWIPLPHLSETARWMRTRDYALLVAVTDACVILATFTLCTALTS